MHELHAHAHCERRRAVCRVVLLPQRESKNIAPIKIILMVLVITLIESKHEQLLPGHRIDKTSAAKELPVNCSSKDCED